VSRQRHIYAVVSPRLVADASTVCADGPSSNWPSAVALETLRS